MPEPSACEGTKRGVNLEFNDSEAALYMVALAGGRWRWGGGLEAQGSGIQEEKSQGMVLITASCSKNWPPSFSDKTQTKNLQRTGLSGTTEASQAKAKNGGGACLSN